MAGEGDAERLAVLLEARITEFEKRMQQAERRGTSTYQGLRTGSQRATRQMEADMVRSTGRINQALAATSTRMGSFTRAGLGGLTAGFVGALAPILSVAAAINTAKRALEEFDKLGNRATMLGTNVERLQEFHYAANQSGMAADNFDMALRRMTRRAAEAAQGTGAAKDAFRELGIELHDNEGRLKANDVLLGEVADAMQKVPQQADRLRLAFKIFDTDGAQMLNVLSKGSAGLDEFGQKARALGLVVDEHLIVRAQELKSEFDTATTVLNRQFQQALIALAPFLVQTAQLAANVAMAVRDIGDALQYWSGNLGNVSSGSLDQLHRNLGAERVRIENEILELEARRRNLVFDPAGWGAQGINADIETRRQRLAAIADEEQRINEILLNRPTLSTPGTPDFSGLLDDDVVDTSGARNKNAEAAIKQAQAVQRLIENLKHEQDQLGRTAEEQELYNLLKSVGVDRASEFGQEIEATLGPLQRQREEMRRNAEIMDELGKIGRSAIDDIIRALDDGKITAEEFGDILGNVLRMAGNFFLNMAFNGIGSAFGLRMARGGPVRGPGSETSDSIPAMLSDGEYVVNAAATKKNKSVLDWINSGGQALGFATGGLVASPNCERGAEAIIERAK